MYKRQNEPNEPTSQALTDPIDVDPLDTLMTTSIDPAGTDPRPTNLSTITTALRTKSPYEVGSGAGTVPYYGPAAPDNMSWVAGARTTDQLASRSLADDSTGSSHHLRGLAALPKSVSTGFQAPVHFVNTFVKYVHNIPLTKTKSFLGFASLFEFVLAIIGVVKMVGVLLHMHPGDMGRHNGRGFDPRSNASQFGWNQKIPPYWSNENKHQYTLRQYAQDLTFWCMITDLYPHQQAVAVISRLGGSAGDMCRGMSMEELTVGGPHPLTGAPLAPIAYLSLIHI